MRKFYKGTSEMALGGRTPYEYSTLNFKVENRFDVA